MFAVGSGGAPNSPRDDLVVHANRATFEKEVIERSATTVVVVDFWAEWCHPCRQLDPILKSVVAQFDGEVVLAKINADESPDLVRAFNVEGIPALFVVRQGRVVDQVTGLLPEAALRDWIGRHLPSPAERLLREAKAVESADAARAEALYRQALEADSRLDEARIGLARSALALGKEDVARQQIESLEARGFLEPEAQQVKARLTLAQQAEDAGGVEQARRELAAAPDDLQRQLQLAEALAAAGEYEEALQRGLAIVEADRGPRRDQARETMLNVFRLLGDEHPLTTEYRRKLSLALY